MAMPIDKTDYSVVVKLRAPPPNSWKWEIYRAGRSSPIEQAILTLWRRPIGQEKRPSSSCWTSSIRNTCDGRRRDWQAFHSTSRAPSSLALDAPLVGPQSVPMVVRDRRAKMRWPDGQMKRGGHCFARTTTPGLSLQSSMVLRGPSDPDIPLEAIPPFPGSNPGAPASLCGLHREFRVWENRGIGSCRTHRFGHGALPSLYE